jgi:hypothetical protein
MPDIVMTNATRLKRFYFTAKDNRSYDRIGGGKPISDTTEVSTTSTTRVNLKTYTITTSAKSNYIRIQVWGRVYYTSGAYTLYLFINIDGTDVVSWSSSTLAGSTTPSLLIDYNGSISAGASHTIKIDGYVSGTATLYVSYVYGIVGFGITSTTSINIASLDSNDIYTLISSGNFAFKLGIRIWVSGNRKTTATSTITTNSTNQIQGLNNLGAGNDGGNISSLLRTTLDYLNNLTISGYVGASGDVLIITNLYIQITLRGINADKYNLKTNWIFVINEIGLIHINSRHVSIDGSSQAVSYYNVSQIEYRALYTSSSASDVSVFNIITNNNDVGAYHVSNSEDSSGLSLFLLLSIIVIGV